MTELDERIRRVFDAPAPVTLNEAKARAAHESRIDRLRHGSRTWRLLAAAAVLAVTVGTVAVLHHPAGRVTVAVTAPPVAPSRLTPRQIAVACLKTLGLSFTGPSRPSLTPTSGSSPAATSAEFHQQVTVMFANGSTGVIGGDHVPAPLWIELVPTSMTGVPVEGGVFTTTPPTIGPGQTVYELRLGRSPDVTDSSTFCAAPRPNS